jgi:molybdopterin-guanine dinucleotide biosynthesis protein A
MGARLGGIEKGALNINCIVLAGGKGLRLGRDKVQETVGTDNLLQRVLSQLIPFNCDIIIVTAVDKSLPRFNGYQRVRVVTDIYPGKGTFGGV